MTKEIVLPKHEVLITKEQIQQRVKELAGEIAVDLKDKDNIHLIYIREGAFNFAEDLKEQLNQLGRDDITMDCLKISSYGSGEFSSKNPVLVQGLRNKVHRRNVLLVEDIVDSGHTIHFALEELLKQNPKSIRVCAFLDKSLRREVTIPVDYVGFEIPDKFVFGYGLDLDGDCRDLEFIAAKLEPQVA